MSTAQRIAVWSLMLAASKAKTKPKAPPIDKAPPPAPAPPPPVAVIVDRWASMLDQMAGKSERPPEPAKPGPREVIRNFDKAEELERERQKQYEKERARARAADSKVSRPSGRRKRRRHCGFGR